MPYIICERCTASKTRIDLNLSGLSHKNITRNNLEAKRIVLESVLYVIIVLKCLCTSQQLKEVLFIGYFKLFYFLYLTIQFYKFTKKKSSEWSAVPVTRHWEMNRKKFAGTTYVFVNTQLLHLHTAYNNSPVSWQNKQSLTGNKRTYHGLVILLTCVSTSKLQSVSKFCCISPIGYQRRQKLTKILYFINTYLISYHDLKCIQNYCWRQNFDGFCIQIIIIEMI